MSNVEIEQQTKEIVEELLRCDFSQIYDILPAEKELNILCQNHKKATYPMIGLMLANIMLGNKETALKLAKDIWDIGGELSDFFEEVYVICLLNVGEIKKASVLLDERLDFLAENVDKFYQPMVKYALATGDFELLCKIGEFGNNKNNEPYLYLFAERCFYNNSKNDFSAIIKIATDNLGNNCSAWGYKTENNGLVNLIFYTNAETEQNQAWLRTINKKIESYYLSSQSNSDDYLNIKILNIKLCPAYKKTLVRSDNLF